MLNKFCEIFNLFCINWYVLVLKETNSRVTTRGFFLDKNLKSSCRVKGPNSLYPTSPHQSRNPWYPWHTFNILLYIFIGCLPRETRALKTLQQPFTECDVYIKGCRASCNRPLSLTYITEIVTYAYMYIMYK